MIDHIKIRGLFETHLTVSNLQHSIDFYRDVVGLELALEVHERNSAFFWIGNSGARCWDYGQSAQFRWV